MNFMVIRKTRKIKMNKSCVLMSVFSFSVSFFLPVHSQVELVEGCEFGVSNSLISKIQTNAVILDKNSSSHTFNIFKENLKKDGFKSNHKLAFGRSALSLCSRSHSESEILFYKEIFCAKYFLSFPIHAPPGFV